MDGWWRNEGQYEETTWNKRENTRAIRAYEELVQQSVYLLRLTIFTGKVLDGYVLDGDLLQEVRTLTAGVTRDDALSSQPVAQPRQVTVAVEGIGQKVAVKQKARLVTQFFFAVCVNGSALCFVCVLTEWTGSAACRTLRGSWRWSGCRRGTGDALSSVRRSCCCSRSWFGYFSACCKDIRIKRITSIVL